MTASSAGGGGGGEVVFLRAPEADNGLSFLWGPPRDWFAARDQLAAMTTPHAEYSHAAASELFARLHQRSIRWVEDTESWAVWNGRWWVMPARGTVGLAAKHFQAAYAAVAGSDTRLGRGSAALSRQIGSEPFAKAMLAMASKEEMLWAREQDFDRDAWTLNTPGGLVDLRTGALRPHDPEALCTRCTAVAPDAASPRPRFERFLADVFEPLSEADRAEVVRFVQASLGYCLTGDTTIHALYFWYGGGRNGKSTLGELVLHAAGSYGRKIPSSVLMASRFGERHPTEIAQLRGVRLAVSSEITEGEYWDESRIKEVSGDDTLAARFMHKDHFTFRRTHKHLIFGNNKPRIRTVDAALRARLKLTEFARDFEAENRVDPGLPERLRAEAPGVLAWLIEGAAAVWAAGRRLPACRVVERATDDYFTEADVLGLWIEECCVVDDKDAPPPPSWTQSSVLYANYAEWKRARNEPPASHTKWAQQLVQERRFRQHKRSGGLRGFCGIQLKT